MIAAGRAGCDLTAFNDSDLQAAQRQIVRGGGAGRSSADDDDVILFLACRLLLINKFC
jgi:hypothetical protein